MIIHSPLEVKHESGPSPLRDDLASAHGVVPDLRVAHVTVAGQAHGLAMRLDCPPSAPKRQVKRQDHFSSGDWQPGQGTRVGRR